MPSTSAKQAKFMRAVAHSPKFAKKVGVSQSVGKDFEMADKKKGKKFGKGGPTNVEPKGFKPIQRFKLPDAKPLQNRPAKPVTQSDLDRHARIQGEEAGESKVMKKAKGGSCYAKGGKSDKAGRALVKKSADTMGRAMMKKAGGGKCYAKGGSVSSRADGCATKGKTHTKMVAMKRGGKC